jgi:homoserine dehydrogenase
MSDIQIQPKDTPTLCIGLFGFGVVGEGLYKVLQQTPSLNATIKKVCIRNAWKKRNAPAELFTDNPDDLLEDGEINVIVELIDDATAAFGIVSQALSNHKAVVSANKKMIAEHFPTLLSLQQQYEAPFLYEAACCASIPVIRNLEEYYDNDLLQSISGIVNGSTNFILTRMQEGQPDFTAALLLAQQLGFAESNPLLDIGGFDATNKLSILLAHAYGITVSPADLLFAGIQQLQPGDIAYAHEKHCRIKLVATATRLRNGQVAAFVLPQLVAAESQLFHVQDEYNGVLIESSFADRQFFYGKGAGSLPTASAVLSDISALRYAYRYAYRKKYQQVPPMLSHDFYLQVYVSAPNATAIPTDRFTRIEERFTGKGRNYITGVIAASALQQNDWWKQEGISLIVGAAGIMEDVELRSIQHQSLTLAGVKAEN